jgi:hypothetical protein
VKKSSTPSVSPSFAFVLSAAARVLMGLIVLIAAPSIAGAARVSGILTGYESSSPEPSRDLHFQNATTHDIYLSPTHTDGSFALDLPPGLYDLRTESGVISKHAIAVGETDVALGVVSETAPYAPARLFQFQNIAASILTSPAPSTAYIMTVDTTSLPTGTAYPAPKIDWSKLPAEVQKSPNPAVPPVAFAPAQPPPATDAGGSNGPMFTEPPLEPSKAATPAGPSPSTRSRTR